MTDTTSRPTQPLVDSRERGVRLRSVWDAVDAVSERWHT